MFLLANACSHTAGAEIEYTFQNNCYDKAWPKHLANKLGCDHVNLAVSGASNHRIIRTTIDFIGKRINEGKGFKDILAIICWPGAYRTELFLEENGDPHQGKWQPLVVGNNDTYKKLDKEVFNYYRYWAMTYTYHQAMIQYALDVITLQNYFMTYNIPYLFWRASTTRLDPGNAMKSYNIQINKKRFPSAFEKDSDFTTLLSYYGYKPSEVSKYNHFGEDGQIKFAELLFNYIQDNQIVSC